MIASLHRRLPIILIALCALTLTSCALRSRQRNNQSPTSEGSAPLDAVASPDADASNNAATNESGDPAITALEYKVGRNDYVLEVDNTPREMLVYVPKGYDASRAAPVVFMFHGSNQGGPLMYENTDWAVKADQENLIVVYPTAWKYRLLDEQGLHEKWVVASIDRQVEAGQELKDDVKFVRVMIDTLKATFNVDATRLYATGFSNGGGFVQTRLLPEMNDVFAAFAVSGSCLCGEGGEDGESGEASLPSGINDSMFTIMGTNDQKVGEALEISRPFPFLAEELVAHPMFGPHFERMTTLLSLDPSYTVESTDSLTKLTFNTSLAGANNQYIFLMVNNMGHVYPSGDNNRHDLNAADLFWDFFSQYTQN